MFRKINNLYFWINKGQTSNNIDKGIHRNSNYGGGGISQSLLFYELQGYNEYNLIWMKNNQSRGQKSFLFDKYEFVALSDYVIVILKLLYAISHQSILKQNISVLNFILRRVMQAKNLLF